MKYIFVDMKTNQITVAEAINNSMGATAQVFLGPKHPGMVFTSVYLASNTCDYEVYTGGPLVADKIKELAEGRPGYIQKGKRPSGKAGVPSEDIEIEVEAIPGNLGAALDFARNAGALVAKLVVQAPKVEG